MSKGKPAKKRIQNPQAESASQKHEAPAETGLRAFRKRWISPEGLAAVATVWLAGFAFVAWRESVEGTNAMRDQAQAAQSQLEIMQAQQEPTFEVSNAIPTFDPVRRRLSWVVYFQNEGKGAAYDFKMELFMKTSVQFEYLAGDSGAYSDLDKKEGSTFLPGQHAFVTLISPQTLPDQEAADRALASGDVANLIHFRYKTAENGRVKDQWFCSAPRGAKGNSPPGIFDIPKAICIDLLPSYVPRPKTLSDKPTQQDEKQG